MIISYVIGVALGIPLALYYPRMRDRSLAYRFGVGLLASLGIAITINASLELVGFFGLSSKK